VGTVPGMLVARDGTRQPPLLKDCPHVGTVLVLARGVRQPPLL
jgi:hypothetical protein